MKLTKTLKTILLILFVLYIIILSKVVLFKYGIQLTFDRIMDRDNLPLGIKFNIIPLKTILFYFRTSSLDIAIKNVFGNIIIFIPMGFLLPLLFKNLRTIAKSFIFFILISLSFEYIQMITGIGVFDIDDIILNILGSIIGFVFYKLLVRRLSTKSAA